MMLRDVRKLIEKLNDHAANVLQNAVAFCVNRGHYEVRWEHILLECIDEPAGEVAAILRHFGIDTGLLKKAIETELSNLQSGNTGKPTFSPPLLESMELAWLIGSINYGYTNITTGTLFLAGLERGQLSLAAYGSLLSQINLESVRSNFGTITAASSEQSRPVASPGQKSGPSTAPARQQDGGPLNSYCTNFTQQARDNKIDPVLGRDAEIRQAIDILSRRRKNNPILVGEAGVGKTAIVEGLALRIAAGDVPDHLKNVDLWGLDLGLLQAGASVKGEFEKRLTGVIEACKTSVFPTLLFIDEAHTLIGAGGPAGGGDAANLLKPALARGELRTIAATTWLEYRKYFEKDPALARRFQLVKIDEPDEATAIIMMRGVAKKFTEYHKVRIASDAIEAAVKLSHRYITGRQLPDKSVDVLDTAAGRVGMSQTAVPSSLDAAVRQLEYSKLKLEQLLTDDGSGLLPDDDDSVSSCRQQIATQELAVTDLTQKWEAEKAAAQIVSDVQGRLEGDSRSEALRIELATARQNLAKIAGEQPMVFPYVSAAVCGAVISDWTGIPVGSMVKDEAETLINLEETLQTRVIGQDAALIDICNNLRTAKAGLKNPDAPLGVFLFAGPSGVGKTETALALATLLFGSDKFLTTINMSEYQEQHTVSQLKGAPPGYVGFGEGGILTEAVRQKPYSLVILDEVEKAHIEVLNLFYQVFDKGFMRDGEGREIDFRNTVIIMTSNLGSDTIIEQCSQDSDIPSAVLIDDIRAELTGHFKPALLGRCTVVPFKPLPHDVLLSVVALKLDKIGQRLADLHKITLQIDAPVLEAIAGRCTAVEAGARSIDIVINGVLLPRISRELLSIIGSTTKYTAVKVSVDEAGEFAVAFE